MKKLLAFSVALLLLTGCGSESTMLDRGVALRQQVQQNSCCFDTEITADFRDRTYTFSLRCTADAEGRLSFTVLAPEAISDISGEIAAGNGRLTYTDTALAFPILADGAISPVSAPWLLIHTLRGGNLAAAGMEGENLRLTFYDSFREDALQVELWLDARNLPMHGEIFWQGRRVVSMTIGNFRFL